MAQRSGFDPHVGPSAAKGRCHSGHHQPRRSRRPAADLRRAGEEGLEQGKHRLELGGRTAHLAAHPRNAPRDQRQEALVAPPAQQLRHQHQPCLPFGRAAARDAGPATAARRPPDGRRRGTGHPQRRKDPGQCREEPQRAEPCGRVHRSDPRPDARKHPLRHPGHLDSRETRSGRRPDHRGHHHRHVRPPHAHDHLHDAERQPDAPRPGTLDVPRLPGA